MDKAAAAATAAAATDESQTEKKETVDELDSRIPLSEYQYDIETVEMLAENLGGSSKSKQDKDPVVLRKESRGTLLQWATVLFACFFYRVHSVRLHAQRPCANF